MASDGQSEHGQDFNKVLVKSIDQTIANLFGQSIVVALHDHLSTFYDVSEDELPYRLDTLSEALEKNFGLVFRTIEKSTAKTFFHNLNLTFHDVPHRSLRDYVEEAKRKVASL